MWQTVRSLVYKPATLLVVYIAAAIIISLQLISFGYHDFVMPVSHAIDIMNQPSYLRMFIGGHYTEYNNYVIFRSSWHHLASGLNLYGLYPAEQWDFYKYSPTFALFMGFFAHLPDYLGLSIWNVLNGAALFFAIRMLPFSTKTQCLLLWFMANELMTSYSNTQSNALMCALMVAGFACLHRRQLLWATLWLILATFIKLYGIVGFFMFLFYPGKARAFVYAALWTLFFAALPLCVTSLHTLVWQYQNWYTLISADVTTALGISVTGWLHTWFGVSSGYGYVSIAGLILFLLPFGRISMYKDQTYRLLILALMLIWVIIFNRKAESPTYIIAVTGVGIWYFALPRAHWRTGLLLLVLVFTSLSTTDFFPRSLANTFFQPYTIKAVPCIIAFVVILTELLLLKPATDSEIKNTAQEAPAA